MKFKVLCLRSRGRRLPWSEVRNGPWHVGDLVSRYVTANGERHNVLALRPADPMVDAPIADLYEPVLVRFSLLAFRIRGFERAEGSQGPFAVLQDWHCELP
ncbi:MAG TPA: hypothetical protein VHK01_22605 [Lacipirellulaceae bacterium]|nr:hypothetical protein [Lacipirellulaceae bacterium]